MSEADAEHGNLSEQRAEHVDFRSVFRRVAGTVREHDAVGRVREDFRSRGPCRNGRDLAATADKLADDVGLCAVIDERDAVSLLFGREYRGHAPRHAFHGVLNGICLDLLELCGDFICKHGVHDAALADSFGERAGIDARDAGHAVPFQKFIQRIFAAEIGGRVARLAHDIAENGAFSLEIRLGDTVISDERESLQNDLSEIARIGQRFRVAAHPRRENELADACTVGAEGGALIDGAVLQNQISFFHILIRLPP